MNNPTKTPILQVQNLQVRYKELLALDITSELTFYKGDCIGIMGNNGAGKTTFINACIGGVPYSGNISMPITQNEIAVHLQENNYLSAVSIQLLIETILHTSLKENTKLMELIEFFSFTGCLKKKYKHLSGGEKQKLTLILVIMQEKELIFFDEITSGLDFLTRKELVGKIKDWYNDRNATLVFVSHYYDELEDFTDTLMILDKGKLVAFDSTTELFKRYCGHATISIKGITPEVQAIIKSHESTRQKEGWSLIFSHTQEETKSILTQLVGLEVEHRVSYLNLEAIYMKAIAAAATADKAAGNRDNSAHNSATPASEGNQQPQGETL